MVDAVGGGGGGVSCFGSPGQENRFLDAFSKNFVFVPQIFCCSAEK